MDHNRNNLLFGLIAVGIFGFSLALTLLQFVLRLPVVISSVSWNL